MKATATSGRRWVVVVLAVALAAAGCSDSATTTTPVPTEPAVVSTQIGQPDYGDVADLLDAFPLEGIEVTTDRKRFAPGVEQTFVAEARNSVLIPEVGVDLEGLSDGTVVYLGYLYCATLDQGDDPRTALSNVAASLGVIDGVEAVTDDQWWRATNIALAITAAPCGEYFDATVAYIESLD